MKISEKLVETAVLWADKHEKEGIALPIELPGHRKIYLGKADDDTIAAFSQIMSSAGNPYQIGPQRASDA